MWVPQWMEWQGWVSCVDGVYVRCGFLREWCTKDEWGVCLWSIIVH